MKNRALLVLVGAVALSVFVYVFLLKGDSAAPSLKTETASGRSASAQAESGDTAATQPVKPASLQGQVLAADGTPVAAATVALVAKGDDMAALSADEAVLRSGADGSYAYESLPPGDYAISANAPGFLPRLESLTLAPGQGRKELNLQLQPGGVLLSGTVHDATGGIVPTAVVQALPLSGTQGASSGALSNDDGTYSMGLGNGHYMVWAYHPDYVPHSQLVEISGGPLTVDFRLAPGAVVEGQVKHLGSNEPVPGAVVSYATERVNAFNLWAGAAGSGETVADEQGRFRIAGLNSGSLRLTAQGKDSITDQPTHIALGIAEHRSDVELFVDSAYRVSGRVVDANTGEGVVSMMVSLESPNAEGKAGVATSDESGAFEMLAVAAGDYRIRAQGEKYLVNMFGAPLSVEGDTDAGEIKVSRGAMIRGRVEPAAQAEVSLDLRSVQGMTPGSLAQVQCEADGSFEIGPFTPSKFRLKATTSDGSIGTTEVDVPAAGLADVVINVAPGGSLEGKVVDARGEPVGDVRVDLRQDDKGSSIRVMVNGVDRMAHSGRTSPDGSFLIQGLGGGDYQMRVVDGQAQPLAWAGTAKVAPKDLSLAPKEKRTGEVLKVEARNATIRGRVSSPDGQPAADTWVSASLSRPERMRGPMPPPPGSGPSGEAEGEETNEVRSEVNMVMIQDDDSGEGGAPGLDLSRSGEIAPVLTDEDGNFEITGLRDGEYDLIAEGMKGAARAIVKKAKTGQELEIRLAMLTRIEGQVTLSGEPVKKFRVELSGAGHVRKQIRDEEGRFVLYRLDPGPYTVRVRGEEGEAEADVTVVAGKSTEVEIALQELVAVSGTIVDEAGKPIEGLLTIPTPMRGDGNVQLSIGDDVNPTGADGKFEFGVKPGSYLLMVLKIGAGPMATVPFEAAEGATVDLGSIVAKPGGGGMGGMGGTGDDEEEHP